MLSISSSTRVFVYRGVCDMRRSFEGLASLAREVMSKDPLKGHLFVFMNRSRTSMKVLYWDRSGYAIWYKTLQRGTYTIPQQEEITSAELGCILEGIEYEKLPRKRRFSADFVSPELSLCAT